MTARRIGQVVLAIVALQLWGAAQSVPPAETSSIEGIILDDATGRPLSGVNVWGPPKNPLDLPIRAERQTATTSADGQFLLEKLGSGRLEIFFFKSGYTERLLPIAVPSGQRASSITVRLSATGVIAGQVLDTQGRPLVGARAHAVTKVGNDRMLEVSGTTNDKGEFRILDLPPKRYWVEFEGPGGAGIRLPGFAAPAAPDPGMRATLYPGVATLAKAETVEVKGGEVVRLKPVLLSPAGLGSVRVRVVNGRNEPARYVQVTLYDLNWSVASMASGGGSLSLGSERTDERVYLEVGETATKTFSPSRVGLFEARVAWNDDAGKKFETSGRFQFSGEDTETELVAGKPEGRVSIHAVREELDGTTVPARGTTGGCRTGAFCLTWKLDDAGKVDVTEIPTGTYSLDGVFPMTPTSYVATARQGSRDVLAEGFLVTTNSVPLEVQVKLTAGTLRGKVVDNRGNAVADALVAVVADRPPESRDVFRTTVRTDQLGTFDLDRMRPGTYRAFTSMKRMDWLGDSNLLDDPEFLKEMLARATPLQIEDSKQASVELVLGP